MITFHVEADGAPADTIKKIRSRGMKSGMTLRPATPVEELYDYLDDLDMVLVMTVEPGFGGQRFMPLMCEKIIALRTELKRRRRDEFLIEVDGGIDETTAKTAVDAGANVLVAGSFIFKSKDRTAAINSLKYPR